MTYINVKRKNYFFCNHPLKLHLGRKTYYQNANVLRVKVFFSYLDYDQLFHLFHRADNPHQMLAHVNILHENSPKFFIVCDHVQLDVSTKFKIPVNTRLKCNAVKCDFECESNEKSLMEEHRWKHFKPEEFVGFSCAYCGFSSIFSHQVLFCNEYYSNF